MPLCLMCHAVNLELLYHGIKDLLRISQRDWEYWKCKDCGSVTLNPFPSQKELISFYPPYYSFKDTPPVGGVLRRGFSYIETILFYNRIYNYRVRLLIKQTGLRPGHRILDIGCGSGLLLKRLSARGYHVEGVEISQEEANYVEENYGIKVFNGLLEDANFPERHFDAAILYHVLEHSLNPRGMLKEVFKILKPGGWVVIGIPIIEGLQHRLFKEKWWQVREAPRHIFIPSRKGLERLLMDIGFSKVEERTFSTFEFIGINTISLLPIVSSPLVYGQSNNLKLTWRRFLGGLIALLVAPVALAERIMWITGRPTSAMIFFGKK